MLTSVVGVDDGRAGARACAHGLAGYTVCSPQARRSAMYIPWIVGVVLLILLLAYLL
jgi:hypothetical protein